MSISFPLSLSEFWDAFHLLDGSSEFELLQYKLQSADGGGNMLSAKLGQPKWRADVEVAPQYHQETGRVSALLKALQGRDGTFLAYDRTKPYPVSDPDGMALANGSSASVGGEAASGNLVTGTYHYEGGDVTLNQAISMASDAGSYFDADGFLQTAAANTLRVDYGPFANYVRNFKASGIALGNPGQVPTNWAGAAGSGISREIVAAGSESGIAYVDVRFFGTAGGASNWAVYLETGTQIKAASGQTWSCSAWMKLVAGALPVDCRIGVDEINSAGTFLTGNATIFTLTSSLARQSHSRLLNQAATAFVRPVIYGVYNNGQSFDFTIRVGVPLLNRGSTPLVYPRVPLGVLTETSFIQRLLRSREFDHTAWTKSRATVTANVSGIVDPWGGANADKLIEDTTASNTHLIYQFYTTANYVNHVTYVIAKAAERTKIQLQLSNFTTAAAAADFDLLAGTVTNVVSGAGDLTGASAAIYDLGNGWYWCELKALKITGDSDCHPTLLLRDASGNTSYTGDGVSGIYLAHAQLEEGSVGHMPVITTSAAVQRAGDQITFKARGTNDFVLTYDDGSTQSGPGAVGNWSPLSAGFLRPRIKAWSATRKAQPGATSVQVKSKGANNRSLSLKGLLPFFSLSIGDRISVNYASGRRALLELMEDVTANYLGETVEFEVQPFLSAGIQVDDTVDLTKPCGKFKIVNGSFKPASVEAKRSTGSGFSMISVP
jgi:hypothetical protein